jgi:hypothetical protein
MESLPVEIICGIYDELGNDSNNFRKVSSYLRDCYPGDKYMHKKSFNKCLEDIKNIEYKIIDFSVIDTANFVGNCLFTGRSFRNIIVFTETYSLRKLITKITATKCRSHYLEEFGIVVFDEICIITNKQSPNFRKFIAVGDEFEGSVAKITDIDNEQLFKYCGAYCKRYY